MAALCQIALLLSIISPAADATNYHQETYGPNSRCLEHRERWRKSVNFRMSQAQEYGGAGCYEVGTHNLKHICVHLYIYIYIYIYIYNVYTHSRTHARTHTHTHTHGSISHLCNRQYCTHLTTFIHSVCFMAVGTIHFA